MYEPHAAGACEISKVSASWVELQIDAGRAQRPSRPPRSSARCAGCCRGQGLPVGEWARHLAIALVSFASRTPDAAQARRQAGGWELSSAILVSVISVLNRFTRASWRLSSAAGPLPPRRRAPRSDCSADIRTASSSAAVPAAGPGARDPPRHRPSQAQWRCSRPVLAVR